MQKSASFVLALSLSVFCPFAFAGANTEPNIDGVSNGSPLKYNQNCLDIAYKNAYGQASGKPTAESEYKNYKCYINKKVVPCTSMFEDGQTTKAEADYQAVYQAERKEQAKDVTGTLLVKSWVDTRDCTENCPVYYGTAWAGSDASERELQSDPAGVITGFYFAKSPDAELGTLTMDVSIDMLTLATAFPYDPEKSGEKYTSEKGFTIELSNGKSITFHDYAYWDDGGGKHYQFRCDWDGCNDLLGLSSSVGQKLTFKATW